MLCSATGPWSWPSVSTPKSFRSAHIAGLSESVGTELDLAPGAPGSDVPASRHRVSPHRHLLVLAWEALTRDEVTTGGNPKWASEAGALSETVLEVDPNTNEIVWQWRLRDHFGEGRDEFDLNARLEAYAVYARTSGEPLDRVKLFSANCSLTTCRRTNSP